MPPPADSPHHAAPSPETPAAPLITLDQVSFAFDSVPVLENASLRIGPREFVSVIGPNGGGKTTLIKLILGLFKPTRGTVRLLGQPPHRSRRHVGYMPQHAHLDPQFPVTVLDVVLMGRLSPGIALGLYRRQSRDAARSALAEVGLDHLTARPFAALSGGQRQRVLIARALACQPRLLLLDEPTANLDPRVEEELYELLARLTERLTVLLVSHDVGFVSRYVSRVICVNRSVVTHETSALTGEDIQQVYSHDIRAVHHHH